MKKFDDTLEVGGDLFDLISREKAEEELSDSLEELSDSLFDRLSPILGEFAATVGLPKDSPTEDVTPKEGCPSTWGNLMG